MSTPSIETFFDPATYTLTYVVFDPSSKDAVVIDPVLDYDPPASQTSSASVEKVAAFVDIKFLAGGGRANGLYRELPPNRVWIITPRPSCPPGEVLKAGGKAEGGTADWIWMVWGKTAPHSGTVIDWLRADT